MPSSLMDLNTSLLLWCFHIFFLLLFLLAPTPAPAVDVGIVYFDCLHNTTAGTPLSSTFKHNLNSALSNLTSLSSNGTKYAITSAGSGDDIAYAMFQCRGDQTTQLCRECMHNVTARLPELDCPASIGARIQVNGCYLRYDNQSFFTPDFSLAAAFCFLPSNNPAVFEVIDSLMGNVTTLAPQQGGFASASADGEYAGAQCLGYLNESECSQCLATYDYKDLCNSTLGEQLHLTSCYYRYEPYLFFDVPSPPPPGRPAASLPPTAAPPTPNGTHQDSKTPIIIVGSLVGAIIAIVVLCFIFVRQHKANKIRGERGVKPAEKGWSWTQSLVQTKAEVFTLEEMEEATEHFHPNNMLGEGGFGLVYKVHEI